MVLREELPYEVISFVANTKHMSPLLHIPAPTLNELHLPAPYLPYNPMFAFFPPVYLLIFFLCSDYKS